MSFSGLFIFIIVLMVAYYAGMIAFDIYRDKLDKNKEFSKTEEEIDISGSSMNFESNEVTVDSVKIPEVSSPAFSKPDNESENSEDAKEVENNDENKSDNEESEEFSCVLPFPWTVTDLEEIIQNIELDEDCLELRNVVYSLEKAA